VSLAANALFLATLAADFWRDYPVLAASAAVTSAMPPGRWRCHVESMPQPRRRCARPQTQTIRTPELEAPIETSAAVEQKILWMVDQSPTGKLPPALVDPRTGPAKNNLQAVCHRVTDSFLCTVRPARHRLGEGLDARYRGGRVTWYPYRAG
jgi:hypothetical protein